MPQPHAFAPDAPLHSHLPSAALYRALTLGDRAPVMRRSPSPEVDEARGRRRLRAWKQQRPFASGPVFARRLAAAGLEEEDLVTLLGESEDRLRARHWPPGWLADLSAALNDATDGLDLPDSVKARLEHGFLVAVSPLVRRAQARLEAGTAEICARLSPEGVRSAALAALLGEEMVHAVLNHVSRPMVLELHVARLQGTLRGSSGQERFETFIDRFRSPAARTAFFHEYPVLGRLVTATLDRHVQTRLEFLERLLTDRETLRETFGGPEPTDDIVEVRGIGDPHRGGRCVLLVRYASGFELVYKPKPLAAEEHFQDLLYWLNDRGWSAPFRGCRLVNRGDYGWMEFLRTEPCRHEIEVSRFYRRIGGALALFHTLGATDLHFENLIAVGEHPMFIDLETLFHPALVGSSPDRGTARANREIAESVLSVGLLPERTTFGAAGAGVDLSGLGAQDDQVSSAVTPCWVASGTDTMRFDRRPAAMPLGEHSPALGDAAHKVGFGPYADDLLAGFDEMYRLLCEHRETLLAPRGPLSGFAEDRTRVVLRPTHDYYSLYREGGHPDLLRDALERDQHFDRLWAGVEHHPSLEPLVGYEREDLWWGDIPIFTTCPSSRAIWTGRGHRVDDYFDESGMQMVARRLRGMGQADLERQEWLVRAALATGLTAVQPPRGVAPPRLHGLKPLGGNTPFEVARAVADRLLAFALRDEGHASWIGEMPANEGGAAVRALGPDLYSGLSGVALFLAWMGTLSGDERYRACAREAVRTVRAQVAVRAGAAGLGGFSGWGSVVYALSHLSVLLEDAELLATAEALSESLVDSIDTDDQLDVISGAAGFLLALLSLHRVSGSERALEIARRCGDRLVVTAQPIGSGVGWTVPGVGGQPLAGFSHGVAGIALSLLELSAITGDPSYRATALAGIRYERSLFDAGAGNWHDLRPDPATAPSFLSAWCHGAPGIGLARLSGLHCFDEPAVRLEIETAVATTLREGFEMNHSLCHGALGNLELPLVAARELQRADWRIEVQAATDRLVQRLSQRGPICGSLGGVETPGLMNGLAGIGYGLLRLAHPDRVPSVLVMEPPRSSR